MPPTTCAADAVFPNGHSTCPATTARGAITAKLGLREFLDDPSNGLCAVDVKDRRLAAAAAGAAVAGTA
ncbi:MAG: hypothetical protein V4795_05030 [Pseudomonadota bacterium]